MLTPWEVDLRIAKQERAARDAGLTPQHSAAAAGLEAGDDDEDQADEVRRRIQHEANLLPPDAPEVAHADLGKIHRPVNVPEGYPPFGHVSAEAFRRGPVTAGEAAYGIDYDVSGRPVPVPSETLSAAAIGRPLITGGQSAPSAGTC